MFQPPKQNVSPSVATPPRIDEISKNFKNLIKIIIKSQDIPKDTISRDSTSKQKTSFSGHIVNVYTTFTHILSTFEGVKTERANPLAPETKMNASAQHRNTSWHEVSTSHPCFGGEGITSNFRARKKNFSKKFFSWRT